MFTFTAATINLCGRAARWSKRRHVLVGQLVDARPDLIALQEINAATSQGGWLARQVNIRLTGDARRPYRIIQARRTNPRNIFEAVGVMTRLPVIYHEVLSLGIAGQVALRLNVELPAGVAGAQRQSLDFVSVRLHDGPVEHEARLDQTMNLIGWLNERRRVPLQVIAGDFSDPPHFPALTFIKQSYRSAYEEVKGSEPLATFPTRLVASPGAVAACCDYVFVSPAVYKVKGASIFFDKAATEDEALFASDHVGLLVGLEV
jgi:endonuclease/exonuclease/phosphatase family metal-dependent hydrolase